LPTVSCGQDRIAKGSHSSYAMHRCTAPATNPGCLGPKQTRRSAGCPAPARSPYSVLLRVGFAMPLPVTGSAVRFYRTLSPLP